jgi:hypothetical protein
MITAIAAGSRTVVRSGESIGGPYGLKLKIA